MKGRWDEVEDHKCHTEVVELCPVLFNTGLLKKSEAGGGRAIDKMAFTNDLVCYRRKDLAQRGHIGGLL